MLKTGQNFAVGKTLVWSVYVWRTGQYMYGGPLLLCFFLKKVINELGSHFSQICFKEMKVLGARFSFPVNFNS